MTAAPTAADLTPGRPVVFRDATVLTMDDAHRVLHGDVHTVVVNGRVVKFDHRLVGADLARARQAVDQTVEHLMRELGPEAWAEGMHPEIPETKVLNNPYTYADAAQWQNREAGDDAG